MSRRPTDIRGTQLLITLVCIHVSFPAVAAFLPSWGTVAFERCRQCSSLTRAEVARLHRASPLTMHASLPPSYYGQLCARKKAVIFDIDGTLADSFHLAFSATNEVLQKNGYSAVTADEYHYGSRFTTPIRLARHAGLDPEKDGEAFSALGKRLAQEFDDLYIGLVYRDNGNAKFYPGIRDLIDEIPDDVAIGALTNAAVAYAEAVLTTNGVRDRFAVVHGADDVPAAKPAPDGLLLCCKELNVQPEDAVYVGDSPSDGAAARAAGCCSVAVTWGANTAAALARNSDGMVGSVLQLGEALLGLPHGLGRTPKSLPTKPNVTKRVPLHVLLDRDGVINKDVGSPGVVSQSQLQLLPGASEAIWRLRTAGSRVSVITNQNAVAKGALSVGELADIHAAMEARLQSELRESGAMKGAEERDEEAERLIDAIFFATGENELRRGIERGGLAPSAEQGVGATSTPRFALKPAADLALAAMELADTPSSDAAVIGDNYRDLMAGLRAGVRSLHLVSSSPHGLQTRGWLQGGEGAAAVEAEMEERFGISEQEQLALKEAVVVHQDLAACVEWMLGCGEAAASHGGREGCQ